VKTLAQNEALVGPAAVVRLQGLRGELADLAFALERRGRLDAADVVNVISVRLAEIETELAAGAPLGAS